jgi:lipoprotein-anchoring transpeptidase ErfK/SrfK
MSSDFLSTFTLSVDRVARMGAFAIVLSSAISWTTGAKAQVLASIAEPTVAPRASTPTAGNASQPSTGTTALPASLQRQVVDYATSESPGTIIVDTPNTHLYFVLGGGKAIRYGIGVGRDGFTWSGTKTIERKSDWPDWMPPSEMLARQPYLPRFMAGGPGNPLGARAMYLSGTVYRIHGTNNPSSIGKHVSSGCIRMENADVIDLYARVRTGTKVVVLPMSRSHLARTPAELVRVAQTHGGIFDESIR